MLVCINHLPVKCSAESAVIFENHVDISALFKSLSTLLPEDASF